MRKYIICFILSGIFFSSITAYATITYQASQIKYTKSDNTEITLDTALNELYTDANDTISSLEDSINNKDTQISNLTSSLNSYKTLIIALRATESGTGTGAGVFKINSLKTKYKYFKVTAGDGNNYVGSYTLRGSTSSGNVTLNFGTKYNISNYASIWLNLNSNSTSSTSNSAIKDFDVELSN